MLSCSRTLTRPCRVKDFVACALVARSCLSRTHLRTLSSTRIGHEEQQGRFQPYFCTALASQPNQVIDYRTFSKARHPQYPLEDDEYLLVLLATPGSLDRAKGEELLIQDFLRQNFSNAANVKLSVLVALVDALPSPLQSIAALGSESGLSRKLDVPEGHPGLSIAVLRLKHAAPNIWCEANCLTKLPDQDGALPHLSFNVQENERAVLNIQLPLANTVFYNGQPSTMYLRRWSRRQSTAGDMEFIGGDSAPLIQQALNLERTRNPAKSQFKVVTNTLLRTITKPRAVAAATGNVVRALLNESGDPQPASQELEDAINLLSEQDMYANRAIEVWAMVTAKTDTQSPRNPSSDHRTTFEAMDGTLLFKVLSGGGGWGEKRGLLSLGSRTDFQGNSVSLKQEGDPIEYEMWTNLIKPGDLISFAVVDAEHLAATKAASGHSESAAISMQQPLMDATFRFGCIPSMLDQMPSETTQSPNDLKQISPILIQSLFGGMSSRGVHLSTSSDSKGTVQNQQVPRSIRTTIDAPYTTVSMFNSTSGKNGGTPLTDPLSSIASDYKVPENQFKSTTGNENPQMASNDQTLSNLDQGPDNYRSGDLEGAMAQAESTPKIRRFTSRPRERPSTAPTSETRDLIDAVRSMNNLQRKAYAIALLQGLPNEVALRRVKNDDGLQRQLDTGQSFRMHKHDSGRKPDDTSGRKTDKAAHKERLSKGREEIQRRLKASSGYFFNAE